MIEPLITTTCICGFSDPVFQPPEAHHADCPFIGSVNGVAGPPEPTPENVALIRATVYCPACSAAAGTPCSDLLTRVESFTAVHMSRAHRFVSESIMSDSVGGVAEQEPDPRRSKSLSFMQQTQPWTAPYSEAFEGSKAGYTFDDEPHRSLMHDLMHVTKAVGILASIAEWADHGNVRLERVDQAEYEGRIADLIMCALHMANNPPKGYAVFDLERAVVDRVERVNGVEWTTAVTDDPELRAVRADLLTAKADALREAADALAEISLIGKQVRDKYPDIAAIPLSVVDWLNYRAAAMEGKTK